MKTTKKLFALMLSAGILLSSCSDDKVDGSDVNPGPEAEEYGYFSLAARDANVPTKDAPVDDGHEDAGTANESIVNAIRVVLYDAVTGVLDYTFDYAVTTDGALTVTGVSVTGSGNKYTTPESSYYTDKGVLAGSTADFATGIQTEGELVLIKDYKMLVLINPTDEAKNYTEYKGAVVKNSTGFKNSVTPATLIANDEYQYFTGTGAAPSEFFMSNFQDFVDVPKSKLKPTKDDAEAAPVTAYVDRAVAKVVFSLKNDNINEVDVEDAILENASWLLDVTNKSSYFMRHTTKMYNGLAEYVDPTIAAVSRYHFYAIDPNFDKVSYERPGSTSTATLTNLFNYIDTIAFVGPVGGNNFGIQMGAHAYAFENTMEADEQYEDVTTAAILKIDYMPTTTALGQAGNLDKYYVWAASGKKYVFTAAELVTIKEMPAEDFEEEEFAEFEALYEFLTGADKQNIEEHFGILFDFVGAPLPISTSTSITGADGVNKLSWYANPVNYYRVLIRHFGDDLRPDMMSWGRWGMVRNNLYKLTLNSISGPGDIDIPEPEGPDDKKSFVAVDIRILPWIVREQGVEI